MKILEKLNRKGGAPFDDGTAPKTTEASKQIIPHRFTSFDILNECFNELSAMAASVGIDWNLALNLITFNSRGITKGIALSGYKGKVYLIASEREYKRHGQVIGHYPTITFKTFRHSDARETFKGLLAAHDLYDRLSGQQSTTKRTTSSFSIDWEAKLREREAQSEKTAKRAKAYTIRIFETFQKVFDSLPREVGNHPYLVRKFGHYAYQVAELLDLRRGNDAKGDFIAFALAGRNGRLVGYQKIYAEKFLDSDGNERDKDFVLLPNSKNGAFAIIGDAEKIRGRAYIVEGMANGLTFTLATGKPCFVALDAGNLAHVVSLVHENYCNNATIIADNDRANLELNGNTGLCKALEAIKDHKSDSIILPPCVDAVNWDLCDVLTTNDFNLEAVLAIIKNKNNRIKRDADGIAAMLTVIDLMPVSRHKKAINKLLAYAVSVAPFLHLDSSIAAIRQHLGDEYKDFIDGQMKWVNKLYTQKLESVKSLFSFKDSFPIRLIFENTTHLVADMLLRIGGVYIDNRVMGAGKTVFMAILAQKAKELGLSVCYIAHRRSLIDNSAQRLGLEHYNTLKPHHTGKTKYVAVCANSLAKLYLALAAENCAVLLIDEIKQDLEHIACGAFDKRDRAKVLAAIKKAIQNAKLVICADADLDQKTVNFLKSCGRPIQRIANGNQATNRPPKQIVAGQYQATYDRAIASAVAGKRVLIQCDTLSETETIKKVLADKYGITNVDCVNSDTRNDPRVSLFLKNPDAYLSTYKPQVVITSPIIGSGLSIEQDHFDDVFLLMTGVIIPTEIIQTSGRYRPAKVINIGFDNRNAHRDSTTELAKELGDLAIAGRFNDLLTETENGLEFRYQLTELDSLRYAVKTQQDESKIDYINKTLLCFQAKGYELIQQSEAAPDLSKERKSVKKLVKESRIIETLNANEINETQADLYKQNEKDLTSYQKRELERFKICETLATDNITIDDVQFIDDGGISKISQFEILQADVQQCVAFDQRESLTLGSISIQTKATERNRLWRLIFEALGISRTDGKGSFTNKEAVAVLKILQTYSNECAALDLGNFESISEKDERYAVKRVNRLLNRLGLEAKAKGKNNARRYAIEPSLWGQMTNYAHRRTTENIHTLKLSQDADIHHLNPKTYQTDKKAA